MSRFRFEIARESDDASLRQLLRSTPTDGMMRISFCREPSYFAGSRVEGECRHTIICRDMAQGGRVIGMGARAVRRVWIGGQLSRLAYLSGLRLLPEYRSTGILARGYRTLRAIHEEDPVPYYVTTIAEGNTRAWETLTSGRAGLPRYRYLCDYHTMAIPLARRVARKIADSTKGRYEIHQGTIDCLGEVIEFWRRQGRHRDFFPDYRMEDLAANDGLLRGLSAEHLLVARHQGEIVGTLGVWDQTRFRQSLVHDYGFWLGRLRPALNLWSAARGRAGLPATGEPLRLLFAALPVVSRSTSGCFGELLDTARRLSAGQGSSHLLLGMAEDDPLWQEVPRRAGVVYRTRLCRVDWDRANGSQAERRPAAPYLEAGSL